MESISLLEMKSNFEAVFAEIEYSASKRGPKPKVSIAQIAVVAWAKAHWRIDCWKDFFENDIVKAGWLALGGWELGSYGRFMLRLPKALPLLKKLVDDETGQWTGFGAIDSTLIALGAEYNACNAFVYKALRKEGASVGHGSLGRCFGVKLTILINDLGEVCGWDFSPASTHDLDPVKKGILNEAIGLVLGDRGYVSDKEKRRLSKLHVGLWARPKANQEDQFCPVQKILYRYREVVESVFSKLKKRYGLVSNYRPRRMINAMVHLLGCLLAYAKNPNKPKMNWSPKCFAAT